MIAEHQLPDASGFDAIADEYDESIPVHVMAHYTEKRAAFVSGVLSRGSKLLDLACGTGTLSVRLAADGYRMVGADLSFAMLALASGKHCRVLQSQAELLPFPDATFDGVVSVATLHHLRTEASVSAAIGEMLRVLKPEGKVVLWDHNHWNPYWSIIMRRVPQDDGTERLVGAAEIRRAVEAHGGRIVTAARLGFVPDFVPRWLLAANQRVERLLEATMITSWLAAHNVIVATVETP